MNQRTGQSGVSRGTKTAGQRCDRAPMWLVLIVAIVLTVLAVDSCEPPAAYTAAQEVTG